MYAGLVYAWELMWLLDALGSATPSGVTAFRSRVFVPTCVAQNLPGHGNYERCLESYHTSIIGYVGKHSRLQHRERDDALASSGSASAGNRRPLGFKLSANAGALTKTAARTASRETEDARHRFHLSRPKSFFMWRDTSPGPARQRRNLESAR
jgi:hypothetical protein